MKFSTVLMNSFDMILRLRESLHILKVLNMIIIFLKFQTKDLKSICKELNCIFPFYIKKCIYIYR